MKPTALEPAPPGLAPGREAWLKREDEHELGAFKWRGALSTLERWRADCVTASTGNHGAATAWAAARVGRRATVFVPAGASATKLAILRRLGADVTTHDGDLDEAKDAAREFAQLRGLPFFEDGAEESQLDGYEAIADEIVTQLGRPPAGVVVPVGNGALIAGIGRRLRGEARVVGVAAEEAPVMVESWRAGQVVESDRCATIADGLAVRVAIPRAVAWLREYVDDFHTVSEDELARAVAAYFRAGVQAEAAAAAALAALPRVEDDGPVVLVVTGRNIDDALLERCLATTP